MTNTTCTISDKIRSNFGFLETAAGGAIFSAGSMKWAGTLAWGNYENNIPQMIANALHEPICRGELALA